MTKYVKMRKDKGLEQIPFRGAVSLSFVPAGRCWRYIHRQRYSKRAKTDKRLCEVGSGPPQLHMECWLVSQPDTPACSHIQHRQKTCLLPVSSASRLTALPHPRAHAHLVTCSCSGPGASHAGAEPVWAGAAACGEGGDWPACQGPRVTVTGDRPACAPRDQHLPRIPPSRSRSLASIPSRMPWGPSTVPRLRHPSRTAKARRVLAEAHAGC